MSAASFQISLIGLFAPVPPSPNVRDGDPIDIGLKNVGAAEVARAASYILV